MISIEQVKELRDKTGVSIMQCRKALEEAGGDMEKAIIILQKKGGEVAAKKSDREAKDGTIAIKSNNQKTIVLTLNCETDFVAKNEDFQNVAQKIAEIALEKGADMAKEESAQMINDIVLKIGENIQIGDIEEVTGDVVGHYVHHTGKTACVVVLKGGNVDVAKDIAMHATAMKPVFLKTEDISEEARENVKNVLKEEVENSDKPEEMKAKILEGKISAYFKEQVLVDQVFFKDPSKTIGAYAKENGAEIEKFVIYNI